MSLVAIGNTGLIYAIKTYVPEVDGVFSNYAFNCIRASISKYTKTGEVQALSNNEYKSICLYKQIISKSVASFGRGLTEDELFDCAILASVRDVAYQQFILNLYHADISGLTVREYLRFIAELTGDFYSLGAVLSLGEIRYLVLEHYIDPEVLDYLVGVEMKKGYNSAYTYVPSESKDNCAKKRMVFSSREVKSPEASKNSNCRKAGRDFAKSPEYWDDCK